MQHVVGKFTNVAHVDKEVLCRGILTKKPLVTVLWNVFPR